jgi:hypothetical protein
LQVLEGGQAGLHPGDELFELDELEGKPLPLAFQGGGELVEAVLVGFDRIGERVATIGK